MGNPVPKAFPGRAAILSRNTYPFFLRCWESEDTWISGREVLTSKGSLILLALPSPHCRDSDKQADEGPC